MRDLGTISPKWDVSFQSIPSGLRELCRREDGKMERAKGNRRHQENKTFYTKYTAMDSPRLEQPAQDLYRSKSGGVPGLRAKVDTSLISYPETISN